MNESPQVQRSIDWTVRRTAARPLLTLWAPLTGLAAMLVAVMLLSMGPGLVHLSPTQTLAILLDSCHLHLPVEYTTQQASVLWTLRLPRAATALLVGGCLSAAGALLQGLFRSPLADPSLVGTSNGAATAAIAFMALVHLSLDTWMGRVGVALAASLGATLALFVASRLSEVRGTGRVTHMLLVGMAMQAACAGLVGLLDFVARDVRLHDLSRWTLGGLGHTTWDTLVATLPLVITAAALAFWLAPALDAIALGDAEASKLGFNVRRVQLLTGLAVALAMAAAVTAGGAIAFVGLGVPPLARQLVGGTLRSAMVGSALLGAAILLAADLIARSIAPPAEIPVGVVTLLLGAPFLLWQLGRKRQRGGV